MCVCVCVCFPFPPESQDARFHFSVHGYCRAVASTFKKLLEFGVTLETFHSTVFKPWFNSNLLSLNFPQGKQS